jgi:hypothetical protein
MLLCRLSAVLVLVVAVDRLARSLAVAGLGEIPPDVSIEARPSFSLMPWMGIPSALRVVA